MLTMSARKSERLMNLLITLLVSRGYVTKQRLRDVIPDYKEAPSEDAFERMFDRDKDDLRALGVPIEVGGWDPLFEDEQGYRIVRSAFELPEISFEADEAAVIGLASRVWQQAGLASATSDALMKLRAAGVEVDREALNVAQPRLAPDEPSFEAFWEGVSTRRRVRFGYRTSMSAEPSQRHLEPWGIVSYRSRWYVVGHDLDREDTRMFRLSRVIGEVALLGEEGSFTVPEGTDIRQLASRLAPDTTERTAVVRVRPGKALGLRHRAGVVVDGAGDGGDWDRLEVGFGRLESLVDELLSYGPDVVAEEPEELRTAVVERLRAVAGAA
jgi:proteasome accessory factor B